MAGGRDVLGRSPWRRVRVRGTSMAPTLADADVVLVGRGRPEPGEITLVRWSARPGQLSIKRAVAPRGRLWFVVGDNEGASTDSRTLGPAEVLGVVRWRLWPRPTRLPAAVGSPARDRAPRHVPPPAGDDRATRFGAALVVAAVVGATVAAAVRRRRARPLVPRAGSQPRAARSVPRSAAYRARQSA